MKKHFCSTTLFTPRPETSTRNKTRPNTTRLLKTSHAPPFLPISRYSSTLAAPTAVGHLLSVGPYSPSSEDLRRVCAGVRVSLFNPSPGGRDAGAGLLPNRATANDRLVACKNNRTKHNAFHLAVNKTRVQLNFKKGYYTVVPLLYIQRIAPDNKKKGGREREKKQEDCLSSVKMQNCRIISHHTSAQPEKTKTLPLTYFTSLMYLK